MLDQLAIGVGILGPHGVGTAEWPDDNAIKFTNRFGVEASQPPPQLASVVTSCGSMGDAGSMVKASVVSQLAASVIVTV